MVLDRAQQPTAKQIAAWRKRVYKFIEQVPELTIEDYNNARHFFGERGIDFAYVPKGWRVCKWVADRPQQVIIWAGPGVVREWLDAPSTLIAEMARLEAEALAVQSC